MSPVRFFDEHSTPIHERLATGLHKLGMAMRQQERQRARAAGLSPAQAHILVLLSEEGGRTPTEVADVLGVSLPTVSDSVRSLVAKGLVRRRPSPGHHRATLLTLTPAGRVEARGAASWPGFLATSLESLSSAQQVRLLSTLMLLLRAMQEEGQVPPQRMCLTCTSFRPNAHAGARPHHCAFANAPMGAVHLRLVCDDHQRASVEGEASQWQQFLKSAV